MSGPYESVSNVVFAGFAKTLDDVYTQGSIALCPTFLRGGIKSKVIEAISYGCVPVGNPAAYEGLGFSDDALAMKDARLEQFVIDPLSSMDLVLEAAVRCLGERGYAGTSLQRVAEAAGVQKRMVLYYFGSR